MAKITIEKLAEMVANGFAAIDKRFDDITNEFRGEFKKIRVESSDEFKKVHKKLEVIDSHLTSNQNQIDELRNADRQIKTFIGFSSKFQK